MQFAGSLRIVSLIASVCGAASVATPAMAQIQTYYRAGAWDAFSGRNDKGGAVCGIGNTNPSDNRRLSIRLDIGAADTVFSASKPSWSIPDGTRVTVVMQIGLNTPWTQQGTGHGHSITWPLDRTTMQPFDQQFRGASSMTVTFPDGNEPSWAVPLAGSSAISDTFNRCVRDLTQQVQATQPSGGVAPPAQGTTQPFAAPAGPAAGPPAGSPADDAPPAGIDSGAAQPNGPAPGPTQPMGTAQPVR